MVSLLHRATINKLVKSCWIPECC